MIYLTFNDNPSGIYYSQVTDVCNFINANFSQKIRVVAFISIRNFFANRRKIKTQHEKAIVIPMIPKLRNWKWNLFTLAIILLFLDSKKVIARGVFATNLALYLKKTGLVKWICYDGRGAVTKESQEYQVIIEKKLVKKLETLEKKSVLESDFLIAVSNELVMYWQHMFNYYSDNYVVIPCTIHSSFIKKFPSKKQIASYRKKFSFITDKDIIFVYSGSSAGWQSNFLLNKFLEKVFSQQENIKLLILAKNDFKLDVTQKYPERVHQTWLKPHEVKETLLCADYGLLIREPSITNKVASPVKFAEYLFCGLKVIISDNIGDSSKFVKQHQCGYVVQDVNKSFDVPLPPVQYSEKIETYNLALKYFSKESYIKQYKQLIDTTTIK